MEACAGRATNAEAWLEAWLAVLLHHATCLGCQWHAMMALDGTCSAGRYKVANP